MGVGVCARLSVCLSVSRSIKRSIDLYYVSTRQKEAPETKLGVQVTDKALSAGAGDGIPRSLRKCSYKQVFPCFCCNCKAQVASLQQASQFACLFVFFLLPSTTLLPVFFFFFFCFFNW